MLIIWPKMPNVVYCLSCVKKYIRYVVRFNPAPRPLRQNFLAMEMPVHGKMRRVSSICKTSFELWHKNATAVVARTFYSVSDIGAEYCDEHVCLSVCLYVCIARAYHGNYTFAPHQIFSTCCQWPLHNPLQAVLQYVMYFRFCE